MLQITDCSRTSWFGRSKHRKSTRLMHLLSFWDQALCFYLFFKILDEEFSEFSADLGMASDRLWYAREKELSLQQYAEMSNLGRGWDSLSLRSY